MLMMDDMVNIGDGVLDIERSEVCDLWMVEV